MSAPTTGYAVLVTDPDGDTLVLKDESALYPTPEAAEADVVAEARSAGADVRSLDEIERDLSRYMRKGDRVAIVRVTLDVVREVGA